MLFLVNVVLPFLVAPIYFILAFYIRKIKPLRLLIMGEETYHYAFWIFFLFGLFFLGRPFQILFGPHPMPFIISSLREFIMIGLITPCVVSGILNQIYYDSDFPKIIIRFIFTFCILLGVVFVYANFKSINGSHLIFEYKFLKAYDGNWFSPKNINSVYLILLFAIRLIAPFLLMLSVGILAILKAISFPKDSLYHNLPKKYFLEGLAIIIFSMSVVFTGIMAYFWNFQTQWYYLGALLAGILGFISLKIPPRNFKVTNALQEHK
jgi:two-component system response regulator YesN